MDLHPERNRICDAVLGGHGLHALLGLPLRALAILASLLHASPRASRKSIQPLLQVHLAGHKGVASQAVCLGALRELPAQVAPVVPGVPAVGVEVREVEAGDLGDPELSDGRPDSDALRDHLCTRPSETRGRGLQRWDHAKPQHGVVEPVRHHDVRTVLHNALLHRGLQQCDPGWIFQVLPGRNGGHPSQAGGSEGARHPSGTAS
mmetsp:Transcript_5233/g.18849  ORF Transcript_5233/g.18849 Transcript_5233/m.18849 type:complete len:205 (-) Transcript_5233:1001-1615(-)